MAKLADALSEHLLGLGVETTELLYTERAPSFRGSSVSAAASEVTASARRRHLDEGYGFWEHVVAEAAGLDTATCYPTGALCRRHSARAKRAPISHPAPPTTLERHLGRAVRASTR